MDRETSMEALTAIVPTLDFNEMCVVCLLFVCAFLGGVLMLHGIGLIYRWWRE